MKSVSDADWALAESAIRKVMDTTLSRAEHKQLSDMLSRASSSTAYGAGFMGLCVDDISAIDADIGTITIAADKFTITHSSGWSLKSRSTP